MAVFVRLLLNYPDSILSNFVSGNHKNHIMMNTSLKLLLTTSFILLFSIGAIAKTDGELPVIIVPNPDSNENRSPEQIPFYAQIQGTYVILGCYSSIGNATVTLTSTAGDDYETIFDTSFGVIFIPISGNSGFYRLDIALPSGQSYYGEFIL